MKKIIQTTHQINAPIENVWANISKASGVNTWLPVISACRLDGNGEGAKRVCTAEQGDLSETILTIDHTGKVFRYSVDQQPFFPIGNVVGTMSLLNQVDYTQLDWSLEFDLADESYFPMIKEAIEGMYAAGASGLETISK